MSDKWEVPLDRLIRHVGEFRQSRNHFQNMVYHDQQFDANLIISVAHDLMNEVGSHLIRLKHLEKLTLDVINTNARPPMFMLDREASDAFIKEKTHKGYRKLFGRLYWKVSDDD